MSLGLKSAVLRSRHRIILCVSLVGVTAVAALTGALRHGVPAPTETATRPPASPRSPIHIEVNVLLPGEFPAGVVRESLSRLKQDSPPTLSSALHVLRLFGPDVSVVDPKDHASVSLLSLLLEHRRRTAFFGDQPALVETLEGIRCRTVDQQEEELARLHPERQSHADQFLALLAEAGIPLSQPLSTARGSGTVEAILTDSLANFHPKQPEIEWSALAFALYLPPRASWTNKYGEVMSFDMLTGELMKRDFKSGLACGGTHLLYSLVVLLRADEVAPVLSAAIREDARSYLKRMAEAVAANQSQEGWWGLDWYEAVDGRRGMSEYTEARDSDFVLITGHHLEWMLLLPTDLAPPRECFSRGTYWLKTHLLAAKRQTMMAQYCPYSHAGKVLALVSRTSDAGKGVRAAESESALREVSRGPASHSTASRLRERYRGASDPPVREGRDSGL
jgi:hypothetical protein